MKFTHQDQHCHVTLSARSDCADMLGACVQCMSVVEGSFTIATRSLLTLLSVPRTLGRRRFAPPDGRVSPTGHRGCPWEAQAFSRVLACTRSSRDAWLRKSHAASRRLALGLPSSRCGVCCPRAALASMHASRAALRMTTLDRFPLLKINITPQNCLSIGSWGVMNHARTNFRPP